jgi:hypothetical protein
MFETMRSTSNNENSLNVVLSNFSPTSDNAGNAFSFEIQTIVKETENQKITKFLKSQLGELYDQYLNPSNNKSSPLGDDKGIPQYSDLFMHQVIRTNLNTGDREVFGLVSDGLFEDKYSTRSLNSISPIEAAHSYVYQVFTYRKNPIDLFKKFVAYGVDVKGNEYFYLPVKWRNSRAKNGTLYADDISGAPIISAYESFTDESFGMTASYRLDGASSYTSIANVKAARVENEEFSEKILFRRFNE